MKLDLNDLDDLTNARWTNSNERKDKELNSPSVCWAFSRVHVCSQ